MKKFFNLALAGTMAIAAASCQKGQLAGSDASGNTLQEISTQFVLNVTAAPKTKMTPDVVQQNNNFRGIQDGIIYTFNTGVNLSTATPYVLNTNGAAVKSFEFPFFFAASSLNNTGNNNQTGTTATASKRVLQLSVPVGTDAVLFYGKAIKASGVSDADFGATNTDPDNGTVISDTPKNTIIKAKKILNESNVNAYDRTGALMIYLINDILGTHVEPDNNEGEIGTYHYTSLPALSWAQLGHQYEIDNYATTTCRYPDADVYGMGENHTVKGLEEVLGKCYYLFTYLTPSDVPSDITFGTAAWQQWVKDHPDLRHHEEYRAGASSAIKSMIIDMYKIITAATEAEVTNDEEANAKRLARQILTRANKYFDSDGDYIEISELKAAFIADAQGQQLWNNYFEGAKDLNKYPFETFGVPEGAAQIGFKPQSATQAKDEFYYKDPNQPLVNPTMESFLPTKYLFPPELWYYVNSPIRTNDSGDITSDNYPDGVIKWNTPENWEGWTTPGAVTTSTRAVAVINSINYGVALLKSNVSYSAANLLDNRKAMTNDVDDDRSIPASTANLQLRGILVGGVNPRMNWQFIRKYETSGTHENGMDLSLFDGVIYDHSLSGSKDANNKDIPVAISADANNPTPPIYTLVYDNYNSSKGADEQNDVYIALEFVNGGDAFWGRDNLIPKDGVFYLVAHLPKPSYSQISGISWPTDHQIPPLYGVDGEAVPNGKNAGDSKRIARIFMQDFVTTANFKIGADALKHAYYSVPDLRASQMSLGLSVDLQWTPGITYDIDL